jgi:thiol-disulfide isomerase/thioredoxin
MRLLIILIFLLSSGLKAQDVIDFEGLKKRIEKQNDTLYVINFWATWCKPCIAELPFFERASESHNDKALMILLVSLDFKSDLERVSAFIQKKQIRNEVVLLSAGNPNSWIDLIDPSWSGAIPATVFYKNKIKLAFHEGDYNQESLNQSINKYLK